MDLCNELKQELTADILPFWSNKMQDWEFGGFYGRIDGDGVIHKEAHKGAVLNARILWTFSSAWRIFKNPDYLKVAERAYRYLLDYFIDKEHGGVYWELDHLGKPAITKKQTYAQAFALYGLSEFYRATVQPEALEEAIKLFHLLEKHGRDKKRGGYFEVFSIDWQPIDEAHLNEKETIEKKTMDTHLHILEAYTELMRVWKNSKLEQAQRNLIHLFTHKIMDKKTHHLHLCFDDKWDCKSRSISYGHDIEASWLLVEAAEVLDDKLLIEKIKAISLEIIKAALEGLQPDGSLIDEVNDGVADTNRHWWVEAETVCASMHAWYQSRDRAFLDIAVNCWKYIRKYIIDKENGEWIWCVSREGAPNRKGDKAGFWKCPYHNGRMCMEVMEILERKW